MPEVDEAVVGIAVREADRLGLSVTRSYLTADRVNLPVVELRRADQLVATGYGKSSDPSGWIGAHFEALERLYSVGGADRTSPDAVGEAKVARDICGQVPLEPDTLIARWGSDYPGATAQCYEYSSGATTVWYPRFLTDPQYGGQPTHDDELSLYRNLLRYSSSLGTGGWHGRG
jgi:hypothetical protein